MQFANFVIRDHGAQVPMYRCSVLGCELKWTRQDGYFRDSLGEPGKPRCPKDGWCMVVTDTIDGFVLACPEPKCFRTEAYQDADSVTLNSGGQSDPPA